MNFARMLFSGAGGFGLKASGLGSISSLFGWLPGGLSGMANAALLCFGFILFCKVLKLIFEFLGFVINLIANAVGTIAQVIADLIPG